MIAHCDCRLERNQSLRGFSSNFMKEWNDANVFDLRRSCSYLDILARRRPLCLNYRLSGLNYSLSGLNCSLSGLDYSLSGRGRIGPGNRSRAARKKESAVKPGSVWDSHSSGIRVAAQLKRPTRKPMRTTCAVFRPLASLFGLASGGVCRAADVATSAVRSYRTISPLPWPLARPLGGIFLLHFP